MALPSHPPRLDYSNYSWQRVQIMKLLVMQFSPPSPHLTPTTAPCSQKPTVYNHLSTQFSNTLSLYPPQHPVLKQPQSISSSAPCSQTPSVYILLSTLFSNTLSLTVIRTFQNIISGFSHIVWRGLSVQCCERTGKVVVFKQHPVSERYLALNPGQNISCPNLTFLVVILSHPTVMPSLDHGLSTVAPLSSDRKIKSRNQQNQAPCCAFRF
jgi:hypothetical protein